MEIKKLALIALSCLMGMSGMAQESYFVKTKNVKKTVVKQNEDNGATAGRLRKKSQPQTLLGTTSNSRACATGRKV